MSPITELEGLLKSLDELKPPGVNKAKIESITAICIQNIQTESAIIQKIYTQFKKAASTHKLGVLYVVDSVTRQWVEKARQAGENLTDREITSGTYGAGVREMTEVLPVMVNEIIQCAPEQQREKIKKLVDIWERGNTFSQPMLAGFKQKMNDSMLRFRSATSSATLSSSGQGVGHTSLPPQQQQSQAAPPQPDAGAILAALANIGKPANAPGNLAQVPPATGILSNPTFASSQNASHAQTQPPLSVFNPPVQGVGFGNMPSAPAQQFPSVPNVPNPPPANPIQTPQGLQLNNEQLMQFLQALAQKNLPPDQIAQVLGAIGFPQMAAAAQPAAPVIPSAQSMPISSMGLGKQENMYNGTSIDFANQNGQSGNDYQNQRYRGRSRSPDYDRRRVSPPNRRNSPTYGTYDPSGGSEGTRGEDGDRRGRGKGRGSRGEYRQRSPPAAQPEPATQANTRGFQEKHIEFDRKMPEGHIKVLSRTLFVGGVMANETEMRALFSRFGKVQTCIVNHDKRHAFVKMINRTDAVAAKAGMEKMKDDQELQNKARQTKWGVGFGPRDCFDYNTGISVVPIQRLTDADHKWALTAENGGTGGQPLTDYLVIEEPDIEIGAGVSSKAISRRMPPESQGRGGGRGNFSARGGFDSNASRFRKQDRTEPRHNSPRPEPNIGVPPPVPDFGFPLPGMM